MTSRERFNAVMDYRPTDRVPYFEEGIREEVIKEWQHQGLSQLKNITEIFPSDKREVIEPDLEPYPSIQHWPLSRIDLKKLQESLDPKSPQRLPSNWSSLKCESSNYNHIRMLRVHRGFFLSMGVSDWSNFSDLMFLLTQEPSLVQDVMRIRGEFAAELANLILNTIEVDAAFFSEPIGGNDRPIISPSMFEKFVLRSYKPIIDVLNAHRVSTIIFLTYANSRVLLPKILEYGFNCLWACETNVEAMNYVSIRREFGRNLRLIGGIDLDALRHGKEAIRREIEEKVPVLLADGGFIPLADGRIRMEVPFKNYVFYRKLLKKITST